MENNKKYRVSSSSIHYAIAIIFLILFQFFLLAIDAGLMNFFSLFLWGLILSFYFNLNSVYVDKDNIYFKRPFTKLKTLPIKSIKKSVRFFLQYSYIEFNDGKKVYFRLRYFKSFFQWTGFVSYNENNILEEFMLKTQKNNSKNSN